jgi:hypothetical protein
MGREQVSDDLVTRLDDLAARFGKCRDASLCTEAADEIERLREALWDIHAQCNNWPMWMVRAVKKTVRAALSDKGEKP